MPLPSSPDSDCPATLPTVAGVPADQQARLTYDTSLPGKGGGGHDFTSDWSDDEVLQVVEFLKTLSGPSMTPAP